MKIRPLHDRVIVKRLEEERTTASGIVIPERIEVVLVIVLGSSILLKFIISPANTAYRTGVFNKNFSNTKF